MSSANTKSRYEDESQKVSNKEQTQNNFQNIDSGPTSNLHFYKDISNKLPRDIAQTKMSHNAHVSPKNWELSEIFLITKRLRDKIDDVKAFIPSHSYHKILDPIWDQYSNLFQYMHTQFDHIKRLEEENSVIRRAKRTMFEMLKLEKEQERFRVVWEKAEKEGQDEEVVKEARMRFHVYQQEVVRAREEAENAKEALLEWVREEAECRI